MRPNTIHAVEHTLRLPVEGSFNSQSRELVRHHTDCPTGRIALRRGAAIRSRTISLNLRRSLAFIPITKRTETTLQLHIFPGKISRSFRAIGGNDHPTANDWIFSQLGHSPNLIKVRMDGSLI